jgi:autotransporter-associated beta strand protein
MNRKRSRRALGSSLSSSSSFSKKLLGSAAAAAVASFALAPHAARGVIRFSEVMNDAPGTNATQDFIELKSTTPGESLAGLSLLFVEGDAGTPNGRGNIDGVITFAGPSTGVNNLYLRHSFSAGPSPAISPDTTVEVAGYGHENVAITWILVNGFTGGVNTDIDANDDGIVDNTPWTSVLDSVGINDSDNAPDKTYGAALGGADFSDVVQGTNVTTVFRDPDGAMHAVHVTGAVGGPYTSNNSSSVPNGYVLSPGNPNAATGGTGHAFIGAGGSNWSTATNWTGNVVPSVAGDIAMFDGGGAFGQTVNLDASVSLATLMFNGGNQTIGAGGGTITMDSATATPAILVNYGTPTINAPIVLTKDSKIAVARGHTLTLAGNVTGTGSIALSGSGTLLAGPNNLGNGTLLSINGGTLKFAAPMGNLTRNIDVGVIGATFDSNFNDATFSGVLSGSTTGTVVKNGTGVITLTNANTVKGQITINAGSLRVQNNAALGDTSGLTFVSGGSNTGGIELDGANAPGGSLTITEPITIEGKTSATPQNATPHINNISGNNSITQPLLMAATGTWYNLRADAGKLTLTDVQNNTGNASARQIRFYGAGEGELTGGISNIGAATGIVSVVKQESGTWTIGPSTYGGFTTVNAGKLVLKTSLTNYTTSSAITVNGGQLVLASDGTHNRVIRTGLVNTAAGVSTTGGTFDISDNKVISTSPVGTATGAVYDGISGQIQSGRNGGAWNGATGIVTSQSAATGSSFTSIGVATAQQVKGLANPTDTATFTGQTVTGSDTLVMYTYGGDANLDGKINVDDYGHIDSSVVLPGVSGWFNGDFNYDGKINVDDYGIIDSNVPIQGAAFPTGSSAPAGLSAVPEPASALVVLVGACIASGTRRKRHR